MLATFKWNLFSVFAFSALHPQYNFLGSLGLLPENRLSLSTKTLLFTVITTSTLGSMSFLTFFVLSYFVWLVDLALFAKSAPLFWNVHLKTLISKLVTRHFLLISVFTQILKNFEVRIRSHFSRFFKQKLLHKYQGIN
ncbi:GSCOCG00001926001-RA-CDS [Cotesia congregata]|nr:GSCOCG00001926001-RA-CDS [Cotesia congregata]